MKTTTAFIALSSAAFAAEELELNFNAHLNFAVGEASTEESMLATHGHDPNDEFTLQGFELNASAIYGKHLGGMASVNTFLDDEDEFESELEEAFLKLMELPGGFELRGGRYLNRFGTQNNVHLHGWNFADANLITTRFLGEEGLITEGGEISWWLPVEHDALLSLSYGDALEHEHGHNDDGGHGHGEIEGEEALPTKGVLAARLKGVIQKDDYNQFTYGLSFITGENGFGEDTYVYGADFTYLWRENGLEAGGKHFRAIVEPIYRDFDYKSEDGDISGSADEWGVHTSVGWGFREQWELGLRFDYLEGVGEPVEEIGERHRSTAALTRSFSYGDNLAGHARLQYNHDWRDGYGHEDAIWLQFQIDFGKGGELR